MAAEFTNDHFKNGKIGYGSMVSHLMTPTIYDHDSRFHYICMLKIAPNLKTAMSVGGEGGMLFVYFLHSIELH